MTEIVDLYGFGSFFLCKPITPRDIDFLILHQRVDDPSMHFAIRCKAALKNLVPNADVTLLSKAEEEELSFIKKCNGMLLGRITDIDALKQLEEICQFRFQNVRF